MKKIFASFVLLMFPLVCGGPAAGEVSPPYGGGQELMERPAESLHKTENRPEIQKPNPEAIMADISGALRLSSKQEDRILSAIKKESSMFDDVFQEYENASKEEKKWRIKMNDFRHKLIQITKGIPELIRSYLDDEQRESFDKMIEKKRQSRQEEIKPAGAEKQPPQEIKSPKKKKKLIRVKRKKKPVHQQTPVQETEPGRTSQEPQADSEPADAQLLGNEETEEEGFVGSYP
ncbi:MAG: hypothetical protein HY746_02215 [Elusimicrobia bacterium]|nr:hypothetical protein [Elusimicrobiota bacterium]